MIGFASLHVIIRLPLTLLYEGVAQRLTAVSSAGSFGLRPNHVDVVSDLQPSVLSLWDADGSERVFAIDEGVLVKQAEHVHIVVRRGLQGEGLGTISRQVEELFLAQDDEERRARTTLSRLEASMARQFNVLHRRRP